MTDEILFTDILSGENSRYISENILLKCSCIINSRTFKLGETHTIKRGVNKLKLKRMRGGKLKKFIYIYLEPF